MGKIADISTHQLPLRSSNIFAVKNKIIIYNACIRTVLTSACLMWGFCSKTNIFTEPIINILGQLEMVIHIYEI